MAFLQSVKLPGMPSKGSNPSPTTTLTNALQSLRCRVFLF